MSWPAGFFLMACCLVILGVALICSASQRQACIDEKRRLDGDGDVEQTNTDILLRYFNGFMVLALAAIILFVLVIRYFTKV